MGKDIVNVYDVILDSFEFEFGFGVGIGGSFEISGASITALGKTDYIVTELFLE
ncbi:MAG: hypothetical protein U0M06_06335 [Clostridia bacterium]|nr:hypothetical protein [Clostridia bacterium]